MSNEITDDAATHSEALLQMAIENLRMRPEARPLACMSLPAPLFKELCARLMDPKNTFRSVARWLATETTEAPSRSAVEHFRVMLFDEYRLAQVAFEAKQAVRYMESLADGQPEAMEMALNARLTQLLTGELIRVQTGEQIDTKRFATLLFGARTVAKNSLDKRRIDAQIENLKKELELKDQRLKEAQHAFEGELQKLKARTFKGRTITDDDIAEVRRAVFGPPIYGAIRQELIRPKEAAASEAAPAPAVTPS